VKDLRKSWKLIAVVAVAAIASTGYVVRSRAFTLIELQYLPAVQLVADQSAAVKVSNVSTESVEFVVDIYGGNGTLLVSKTETLAAGHTYTLPYKQPAGTASNNIRAVVSLNTAHVAVSDIMTFDKTSGEVIAILSGLLLPA
jgi:hypothetical protein